MHSDITFHRLKAWQGKLTLAGLFVTGLLAVAYMVGNVGGQLRDLSTASSDNVQWSLSQLEVEYLTFLIAVERVQVDPDLGLSDVRKRFDILYSRVGSLSSGPLYTVFRDDPETGRNLARLREFVERTVPLIDGPDDVLLASLGQIATDPMVRRQDARNIALKGISYFSAQRDLQRERVYKTLAGIAVLSATLLAALLVLVFFLSRLNRQNRERALENEIRESRMYAIVSTSLDAIIAIDGTGTVLDFNGAAENVFGYSRAEAIGAPMSQLIIPDHLRDAHLVGMKRYQETGRRRVIGKGRIRLEARRKSGEVFPIELSVASARGASGEIFTAYVRDISKEIAAENELKEARDAAIADKQAKSRFFAVMSHEMRTPLNGLLGTMELLGDTALTSQQRYFLRIMEKSGAHLLTHVNDVLDISRLEAGKVTFNETIFNVQAMLSELVQSQSASAHANRNDLRFQPARKTLLVETDRVRLRQVMTNLIGNAIKFTQNGTITVECETLADGKTLELRVIDTGIGIEEDRLEHIFEDFTTLDASFGRRTAGTGLGLGIAQRLTEALGGSIGVESEPGEGSLFWIRLPVVLDGDSAEAAQSATRRKSVQGGVPTAPMRVLLVEDNRINREVALAFLSRDGHVVTQAENGRDGVRLANAETFDVILMDISMPEMDGIEATRTIRATSGPSQHVPIIALTAHTQQEDVENFRAAGMNDVLFKPMTRSAMRTLLRSLQSPTPAAEGGEPDAHRVPDLIDQATLSQFREDIGDQKSRALQDKFMTEMDQSIDAMRSADGGHDPADLANLAHRLSGSAALFGAAALRQILKKIETQARTQPDASFDDLFLAAAETWRATRGALDSHDRPG